jgi:hypothetical protein
MLSLLLAACSSGYLAGDVLEALENVAEKI